MRLVTFLFFLPWIVSGQKATITIAPFEVPSDMQYRYDFNGTGLLEAIPALLESELFASGKFDIIERARLDLMIDEQALSYAGITDGAVDFGSIKGVDYFVMGKISGYVADVDNVQVQIGPKTMYVNNQNVRITLTVKLVSVQTSKLLTIITEEATVAQKGRPRGNSSSQVDQELIDKAAKAVVKQIADGIVAKT